VTDDPRPYPSEWESDVVLLDGGTVHLRPARPTDADRLLALYSRLSDESLYLRFFSPVTAPIALGLEHLTDIDYDRQFALVAELGDELIAIARYTRAAGTGDVAEVAFTVDDQQQGRGVGSVLLEHLAAIAREHGVTRFVAMTMVSNTRMLGVFADAGIAAAVDTVALEDVLLRIGFLAEHVPEIAELDCNPVVVSSTGATVVDAKVRVTPLPPGPPAGVRRLRVA
jgi:GNAT superfamily N-acetyltransferase